MSNYFALKIPR